MNDFYNFEIPSITTKRLKIRPATLDDVVEMYNNWATDERVTKYLSWEPHENIEVTKGIVQGWIDSYKTSPNVTYIIELLENHQAIGTINFYRVDLSFKEASVGYCLGYDYWNKGIMSEAFKGLLTMGFQDFGFNKIKACHEKINLASGRVMQKVGMRYVASTERLVNPDVQLINYAITKEDWLAAQGLEKTYVVIHSNRVPITLESIVCNKPYLNTRTLTIKNLTYLEIEHDSAIIEEYYGDDIIGIDNLTLEQMIINKLFFLEYKISCAESCTGGMIISRLISVSGASNVINESYITYSEEAKNRIIGVKKATISKYGVASIEVAEEMARGVAKVTGAEVTIGVTGYAGGQEKKDTDGVFYFAIKINDYVYLEKSQVFGDRNQCREAQATYILWRLKNLLKLQKKIKK